MSLFSSHTLKINLMKVKNYGFKTPVRRTTNNVTGNKVGGELSGGECKILKAKKINIIDSIKYNFKVPLENAVSLFGENIGLAAMGGYFISDVATDITFEISNEADELLSRVSYKMQPGNNGKFYEKLGLDYKIEIDKESPNSSYSFSFTFKSETPSELHYIWLTYGFIDAPYFIEGKDFHEHYFNSKRTICFPEQFYFSTYNEINGSLDGQPLVLKSCNRCQRFLPINHFNERNQLSFSNHCGPGKAPCKHSGFSKYEILETDLSDVDLEDFIANNTVLTKIGNFIIAHYGHQLECKACKKFFVNAALNHLRTTTQHKEDALRRRAFEKLLGDLTGDDWIYHKFRLSTKKEFDVSIWEKFGKKCFNCNKSLSSVRMQHLDHTMPLASLYPLDETATCLCDECNSRKSDLFPVDFYSPEKLNNLSQITGLSVEVLNSRSSNQKMINLLRDSIIWFFDDFITFEEYTKERDGKRAADSIIRSLQRAVDNSQTPFDIQEEYTRAKLST